MKIINNIDYRKRLQTASVFSALCFGALLSQTAQGLELKDPITIDSRGNCSINKDKSVVRRDATWSDLERFVTIRDNQYRMEKIGPADLKDSFAATAMFKKHYMGAKIALNNLDGEREARRVVQQNNPDLDVHGVEVVVRAVRCKTVQKPLYKQAGFIEVDLTGGKRTVEVSRAVSATRETVSGFSWTTSSSVSSTESYGGSASFGFEFKGIGGGGEAHYDKSKTVETGTEATQDGSTMDGVTTTDTTSEKIEFAEGDSFYGVLPKHEQVTKKVPYVEIEFEESLEGWVVYHCPIKGCNGHYYMANGVDTAINDWNDFFKDSKRAKSWVMANRLYHKVVSIVDDPRNAEKLRTTNYLNDKAAFKKAKLKLERDAPSLTLIAVDFGAIH